MSRPVMLYYGKIHHSHEAMAEAVDAEMIQIAGGNPIRRVVDGTRLDVGDRPVITEGGIPLVQAAWMRMIGNCGPVIHLAADEALMNMVGDVPHYDWKDELAHTWSHRHVDAVLAVSPRLVAEARVAGVETVRLIHPFPDEWKWSALEQVEPDLRLTRVLVVGSYRPKNNLDALQPIADAAETDLDIHVVGPDTDEMDATENVTPHGFVSKERFVELYERSSAFLHPAITQPFPVSTLEALRAGLPPFVTVGTGTSPFVQKVHPKLVQGEDPERIADAIDWYMNLTPHERREVSDSAKQMGARFSPERGRETFAEAYEQALAEITGDAS